MKVIKASIEVTHENGGTQYVGYPKVWLDNKERIPAILYPNDRTDEVQKDGKLSQVVYPVIPDDLEVAFLAEGFELADPAELKAYSDKHTPSRETITDQTKILMILSKVALDTPLTQKEKEALDPTKPEAGITLTKTFVEMVKEQYAPDNI